MNVRALVFLACSVVAMSAAISAPDEAPPAVVDVSKWLNVGTLPTSGAKPKTKKRLKAPSWSKKGKVDFSLLEGKVVVVEFWATWCPPCRKSIPHLNKLYTAHKSEGLVVMGLTGLDRRQSNKTVKSYVKANIKYPVGTLKGYKTFENYNVTGIPHAVVVGRDGKVTWKGNPLDSAFETAVKAALSKSKSKSKRTARPTSRPASRPSR